MLKPFPLVQRSARWSGVKYRPPQLQSAPLQGGNWNPGRNEEFLQSHCSSAPLYKRMPAACLCQPMPACAIPQRSESTARLGNSRQLAALILEAVRCSVFACVDRRCCYKGTGLPVKLGFPDWKNYILGSMTSQQWLVTLAVSALYNTVLKSDSMHDIGYIKSKH